MNVSDYEEVQKLSKALLSLCQRIQFIAYGSPSVSIGSRKIFCPHLQRAYLIGHGVSSAHPPIMTDYPISFSQSKKAGVFPCLEASLQNAHMYLTSSAFQAPEKILMQLKAELVVSTVSGSEPSRVTHIVLTAIPPHMHSAKIPLAMFIFEWSVITALKTVPAVVAAANKLTMYDWRLRDFTSLVRCLTSLLRYEKLQTGVEPKLHIVPPKASAGGSVLPIMLKLQRMSEAAVVLQQFTRGILARKWVAILRFEKSLQQVSNAVLVQTIVGCLCHIIQEGVIRATASLELKRGTEVYFTGNPVYSNAAVRIQRLGRGFTTRKRSLVRVMLGRLSEDCRKTAEIVDVVISSLHVVMKKAIDLAATKIIIQRRTERFFTGDPIFVNAVVCIQRLGRGFVTRKKSLVRLMHLDAMEKSAEAAAVGFAVVSSLFIVMQEAVERVLLTSASRRRSRRLSRYSLSRSFSIP